MSEHNSSLPHFQGTREILSGLIPSLLLIPVGSKHEGIWPDERAQSTISLVDE